MIWDKPWVFGPVMHLLHWGWSLWPVVAAQGAMLSWLVWLCLRVFGSGATVPRHLLACLVVAGLTAAPFSAALLMPDVFTPAVVLGAALLGFGGARSGGAPGAGTPVRRVGAGELSGGEAWGVGAVVAVGTAAHLSHLPVLGALALVVLVLAGWRGAARVAGTLAVAVGILLITNLVGHGRVSLSPYGATFSLARLVATGSAARTVAAECPAAGWSLCGFPAGTLEGYDGRHCASPTEPGRACQRSTLSSDHFLWNPGSPVNRWPDGRERAFGGRDIAPEAGAIVARTVAREPVRVALDAVRDTFEQLVTFRVGDTLTRGHVGEGVAWLVERGFPPGVVAGLRGGLQWRDRLAGAVAPVLWPQGAVIALGAVALGWLAWRGRRDRVALGFAAVLAIGVLANAFATGALSGPHDRYGARVMWVIVLGAIVLGMRRPPGVGR